MQRTNKIRFTGIYISRDEASLSLKLTGDTALVHRGVARMLLMSCPCGCGDILVINIDPRAGSAWRIYRRGDVLSLFPSYWRDTKCESHFILWRNLIYWCDWDDDSIWLNTIDVEGRVQTALSEHFINYEDLAEILQEVPWDVLQACHSLARKGYAVANVPRHKGEFRRNRLGAPN